MEERIANPVRLYLPLLVNPQPEIRHHASIILLSTYGERAMIHLCRLLNEPDQQIQRQAREALQNLGAVAGLAVELQPYRGMYVECLGHLNVYIGNREIHPQDWTQFQGGRAGWRKVQGVFAYLIHCGRNGTSREELGAAVWGGPVSTISLSRTLTVLRQVLAQSEDSTFVQRALMITPDHCMLSTDVYHTDGQIFERTFNMGTYTEHAQGLAAAVPFYSSAMSLYSGPYMSSVPCSQVWSEERRDLLMNAFVIAAERLAEYAYTQRRYQQCIAVCRRALRADPGADDVTAWLLRAYAQQKSYGELERTYHSYLRAAAVDLKSADSQQDLAVQTYKTLGRVHAVGIWAVPAKPD
ncbi:MAG TPA: bacterial transcriptional activator domain-containing protein [Roseiflexaceae bacterium]|nr:bacterial transcriptional activator domain-containing protein [Roseiflexaceae bacterium]